MARAGITYSEVARAASRLQADSRNPTVDNVRDQIGTGSRSTIMLHLRTWRDSNQIRALILRAFFLLVAEILVLQFFC